MIACVIPIQSFQALGDLWKHIQLFKVRFSAHRNSLATGLHKQKRTKAVNSGRQLITEAKITDTSTRNSQLSGNKWA